MARYKVRYEGTREAVSEIMIENLPKPSLLKWAMLVVLLNKGRPMGAREIDRGVAVLLNLSDPILEFRMENGKLYIQYRLAWERTKSKKLGYIEKVPDLPRTWRLTPKGKMYARKKERLFFSRVAQSDSSPN